MACEPEVLKSVPLFALLDDDERAFLASQIDIRTIAARERIYKIGDAAPLAYVLLSGRVCVSTIDSAHQEVVVDEPGQREFFGFASMMEQIPHQTSAHAVEACVCLEISRDDIEILLQRKPHAGMDLLTTLGRQLHATQSLVRSRTARNPNEVIEEKTTWGENLADTVARFGGSWSFIMLFGAVLVCYTAINSALAKRAWDPYPFILLNLFLSMLAAIQAPVIMMSQNRQDVKDRLRGELDFEVNRRSEGEIQDLARRLAQLDDKLDDLGAMIRTSSAGNHGR